MTDVETDNLYSRHRKGFVRLCFLVFLIFAAQTYFRNSSKEIEMSGLTREDTEKMIVALGGPQLEQPVLMFSASWCGTCKRARNDLSDSKIPFYEVDIEQNQEGRDLFFTLSKGYGVVPLILVGDRAFLGYDSQKIKELTH